LSTPIQLTLACGHYDRTEALRTGEVSPRGIELNYLANPVEETFYRMARYHEFDVAEMSLSTYVMTLSQGRPFVAIPVFPSRMFRHSGIYVNANAGIAKPEDLAGKIIGIPEWQVTAAVWIRGFLEEEHGVKIASSTYRTGGLHDAGREEKIVPNIPDGVEVLPIPSDRTLSEMLVSGEIDALYTPRTPMPFAQGHPSVKRLFPDYRAAEEDYYKRTGIFPIMHVVAIRREVYEKNRWIARELFTAFEEAKAVSQRWYQETSALPTLHPWLFDDIAKTKAVMGNDYWRYGLHEDDKTLSKFLRYDYEQGLTDKLWTEAEIFAPEAIDTVKI
jgi:4,5-dihydroxyphthalate decarboxylase